MASKDKQNGMGGTDGAGLELLPVEVLEQAAECLRVMAHPVRLRMVDLLMQGEFIVAELAERCAIAPHQACEHLRLMKTCGLLGAERRGREVYYKIASPQLPSLLGCIRSHCGVAPSPAQPATVASSAKAATRPAPKAAQSAPAPTGKATGRAKKAAK